MADERSRKSLDRRGFFALAGGGMIASTVMEGCSKKEARSLATSPPAAGAGPATTHIVRIASVKTAVEGNVLPELISDFEKTSPYKIELAPGEDVYTWAREGKADLVISHYG